MKKRELVSLMEYWDPIWRRRNQPNTKGGAANQGRRAVGQKTVEHKGGGWWQSEKGEEVDLGNGGEWGKVKGGDLWRKKVVFILLPQTLMSSTTAVRRAPRNTPAATPATKAMKGWD
jgi:hypothetical protein